MKGKKKESELSVSVRRAARAGEPDPNRTPIADATTESLQRMRGPPAMRARHTPRAAARVLRPPSNHRRGSKSIHSSRAGAVPGGEARRSGGRAGVGADGIEPPTPPGE